MLTVRSLLLFVLLWLAGPSRGLAQSAYLAGTGPARPPMHARNLLRLAGPGSVVPASFLEAPIGANYAVKEITAAPGQLITLIVEGINTSNLYPPLRAPAGQDLPDSLAGISVGYLYSSAPGSPNRAPILEVHPFTGGCPLNFASACGQFTAISVQIPFEAQCALCANGGIPPAFVGVVQGQNVGGRVYAETLPDQVHILTTCDVFLNPNNDSGGVNITGLPCPSVVTHIDGSPVNAKNPASAGEELVAYAVGLGQTNPPLATGKLVTAAAPTLTTFGLDFNYRPNALATKPAPDAPAPLYAGATPGFVGLYQIDFAVPPVPSGTPACVEPASVPLAQNAVYSNLTVSVGGAFSFDGARTCVAVPAP